MTDKLTQLEAINAELLEALENLVDAIENAHPIDYPLDEAKAAIDMADEYL